MTEKELSWYAEALAATAAGWRSQNALTRAQAEALLANQGLSDAAAAAVVEHGLAHGWLVEEIAMGAVVLRPGARALSGP